MGDVETRTYEQMDKRIDDALRRIESEAQTAKEYRRDYREKVHKYRGTVGTVSVQVAEHDRDIREVRTDFDSLSKDFKDALGPKGWLLMRLNNQDAKWTRIYFLIISLLLSIITLTITLWLTSLHGGKT